MDMSEKMGEAAGIANPVGAVKGAIGSAKAAKANKLANKAAKLEEQAEKLGNTEKAAKAAKGKKNKGGFENLLLNNLMLGAENAGTTNEVAKAVDASRTAKAGGKSFEQMVEEQGLTNAARQALEASNTAKAADEEAAKSLIGTGIPTALGATGVGILAALGSGGESNGKKTTGNVEKDREMQAAENAKMLDDFLKNNDESNDLQKLEHDIVRNDQVNFLENLLSNTNYGEDVDIDNPKVTHPDEDEMDAAPNDATRRRLNKEGFIPGEWNALEQAEQYYEWLDTDEGKKFQEKYGDRVNKENLGYTNLRAGRRSKAFDESNLEAWADLLGYGDDFEGISGWRDYYTPYGIDWNSENALQDFYDLFYGNQAGVFYDMINDDTGTYDYSKIGQQGEAWNEANLWYALNNDVGLLDIMNQNLPQMQEKFDENDWVQLANAVRATNTGNIDWTNIDDINAINALAGEKYKLGLIDDEEGLYKEKADLNEKTPKYLFDPTILKPTDDVLGDEYYLDAYLNLLNSSEDAAKYGIG